MGANLVGVGAGWGLLTYLLPERCSFIAGLCAGLWAHHRFPHQLVTCTVLVEILSAQNM